MLYLVCVVTEDIKEPINMHMMVLLRWLEEMQKEGENISWGVRLLRTMYS